MESKSLCAIAVLALIPSAATGYQPPITHGPFASVQVNVDVSGNDIGDDSGNEPSIAIDASNPQNMAVGWRLFPLTTQTPYYAGVAYSTNGGQTWSEQAFVDVLAGQPLTLRSDPVLDYSSDGEFYYYSLNRSNNPRTCDMFISTDGGQTWTMGETRYGGDKAWVAVDRTDSTGNGVIYTHWSWALNGGVDFACCGRYERVSQSTDGGFTFEDPVRFSPTEDDYRAALTRGTLDVAPDGTVFAVGQRTYGYSDGVADIDDIGVSKSTHTPGQPLTDLDPIASVNLGSGYAIRTGAGNYTRPQYATNGLLTQWTIKADPTVTPDPNAQPPVEPRLFILGARMAGSNPAEIIFNRSTDGGVTWYPTGWKVLHDQPGWQWFGTMSVAPNGRIDVFYNYTPTVVGPPSQSSWTQTFYTFSLDAGDTWSAPLAVTPEWDSFANLPEASKKVGDYYHSISFNDSVHLAYAATLTNSHQNVYYLKFPFSDCNDNLILDIQDIHSGTSQDVNGDKLPDECCPEGIIDLIAVDPPAGTIDARQPHPGNNNSFNARQGIGSPNTYFDGPEPITVQLNPAVTGAFAHCWGVCESGQEEYESGGEVLTLPPNAIQSVQEIQTGVYQILLQRPISAGYYTNLYYKGPNSTSEQLSYASLPADANNSRTSNSSDISRMIDCLNGVHTCTDTSKYRVDINHSGALTATDPTILIDLLNGAGTFRPWLGKSIPSSYDCQQGGMMMLAQEGEIGGADGGATLTASGEDEDAAFVDFFVDYVATADPTNEVGEFDFVVIAEALSEWSALHLDADLRTKLVARLGETTSSNSFVAKQLPGIIDAMTP